MHQSPSKYVEKLTVKIKSLFSANGTFKNQFAHGFSYDFF